VSLHRDGNCFAGFHGSFWERIRQTVGGRRYLDTWHIEDAPLLRVLQILVPGDELRVFDSGPESDMRWLASPGSDEIGAVTVFISRTGLRPDAWPGASYGAELVGYVVTDARIGWAVYHRENFNGAMRAAVEADRQRFIASAGVLPAPGVRGVLVSGQRDGERVFHEFACQDS
jgi:hypothetical protein